MTEEELTEYFQYLDELRQSGITNMWGASRYVEGVFGLTPQEASRVTSKWMTSFTPDKTPAERAKEALAA